MPNFNSIPIVVIACQVFENLLEGFLPKEIAEKVTFLDYGLHEVPRNLKKTLQEQIDNLEQPSLIILGYGLCGNGLHGIKAGQHTLLVPRTDDCISIFYGSYAAYREQFDMTPGTYYLSKGWLESGSNPLDTYQEYIEKYGQSQADWLVNQLYQNYVRLAFIAHQQADLDHYRSQALEIAQFCQRWGMRYEEILGSDAYVRKLIEVAMDLSKTDGDFLVIYPGGTLEQSQFIR
jgi:hypothetical protein